MASDKGKVIVGILFDFLIHETSGAYLMADEADEKKAEHDTERTYKYSMAGEFYCQEDAIWFPKSYKDGRTLCMLKDMSNEGYEIQLPTWLADKKGIIDNCYGLEEREDDEDAIPQDKLLNSHHISPNAEPEPADYDEAIESQQDDPDFIPPF